MKKKRHKAVPAVYLILEKDKKILLMRRCNTGYMDGKYGLPSGHMDGKESPRDVIIREAKEEVGIKLKKEDLNFVHILYRSDHDETGERVDFFFKANNWEGEVLNSEPEKCEEVSWFFYSNLPENTVDYVKEVLVLVGKGILFSEIGW